MNWREIKKREVNQMEEKLSNEEVMESLQYLTGQKWIEETFERY